VRPEQKALPTLQYSSAYHTSSEAQNKDSYDDGTYYAPKAHLIFLLRQLLCSSSHPIFQCVLFESYGRN